MTACTGFNPYDANPTICRNCGSLLMFHQTTPTVDSDDGPEQSGAPLPPQGAPLTACGHTYPGVFPDGADFVCDEWAGHRPPHRQGRAEWWDAEAPLQNASPVNPRVPHEPTGLATADVMAGAGWARAIELSAHVARLSMVLELIVADYDNEASAWPATLDLARDAIAKAREATS